MAHRGRSEQTTTIGEVLVTTILSASELADLMERMLRTSGRRIDMSTPFVDVVLPDGSRLHVVIPDMIRTGSLACADFKNIGADLREEP